MKLKVLFTAVILVTALILAVACGGTPGASGGTIKIISSYPLTGGDSADGISMANSAKLALQNHGPKSGNYTIVYESMDDASAARGSWDPDIETSNANKAVADPSVLLYLGTYNSGAAKLSIPILNAAGPLAMLSGANTAIGLTKSLPPVTTADEPNKYYPNSIRNYVRIVPPDDFQGAVDARWAQELGAKSVYILHDQQLYGQGVAARFEQVAKELGVTVLGSEGIDTKATDYSAQATKIASANPDLFFFGGVESSNGSLVWKALRSAGYKGIMMGPDGLYTPNFIKGAGADAEGTYITFAGTPVDQLLKIPEAKKWHDDYVKMFGTEPTGYGSYGYEAALLGLKAIDDCVAKNTVTRVCVRDALFNTKDFKGIFGYSYSIDANGDTTAAGISRNIIENGAFKFLDMAPTQ
jgi:branched-chain amino acid transport system substrate-binding protein